MDTQWRDAIRGGATAAVGHLIARGADVDARDEHGQSGLMLAACDGHAEVVDLLLAHGANPNLTAKFGLSATMLAVVAYMFGGPRNGNHVPGWAGYTIGFCLVWDYAARHPGIAPAALARIPAREFLVDVPRCPEGSAITRSPDGR